MEICRHWGLKNSKHHAKNAKNTETDTHMCARLRARTAVKMSQPLVLPWKHCLFAISLLVTAVADEETCVCVCVHSAIDVTASFIKSIL